MTFKIRPAGKNDRKAILKVLKELDLFYPTLSLEGFWVAETDGKIVATLQLAEHEDFIFLGSLAVVKEEQGKGVGHALLEKVLRSCRKNIYLYTIIPDFFKKFGFRITAPVPGLPSKDRYECEYCHPEKCVCMVRPPDVS